MRGILIAALAGFLILLLAPSLFAAPASVEMTAHFINVGQGDATLLEFPCGAVLIDSGTQYQAAFAADATNLIYYLDRFFTRRTDLQNTLDLIIISHNHLDHTLKLRRIAERFRVKRYIDNGRLNGQGATNATWMRTNNFPAGQQVIVRQILEADIPATPTGLTDADIDPIACSQCDPKILILSGSKAVNPGWPDEEFEDNENNHSVVARVDFGQASFLFTGDLELPAIETLRTNYDGTSLLDVKVWHVGHHGSANGTTNTFLDVIKPELAIISVGTSSNSITRGYGHPRWAAFQQLKAAIQQNRETGGIYAPVANRRYNYSRRLVKKNIYATAWDKNILVRAQLDGTLTVTRKHEP